MSEEVLVVCMPASTGIPPAPSRLTFCADCRRPIWLSLLTADHVAQTTPRALPVFVCTLCSIARMERPDVESVQLMPPAPGWEDYL